MLERVLPLCLLLASNVFMTFAWYGHLKYKSVPLVVAILASWGIAFFEYSLMVPANRIGSAVYSVVQLKTIQEVITLIVFAGFVSAAGVFLLTGKGHSLREFLSESRFELRKVVWPTLNDARRTTLVVMVVVVVVSLLLAGLDAIIRSLVKLLLGH